MPAFVRGSPAPRDVGGREKAGSCCRRPKNQKAASGRACLGVIKNQIFYWRNYNESGKM